jgi:CHAD domain-containing protein
VLPFPFDPPPSWPSVDRREPAAQALRRMVLRQLEVAEAQEQGLRADLDSEFCHDLRVAVRRTRSLLGQLRRALEHGEADELRAELAWLGRATGPLRDLDVLRIELSTLEPELAEGLDPLVELLGERQREAQTQVVEVLDSERWRRLGQTWRRWAQGAAPADGPAFGPLVADRVARLARRVRREGSRLGPDAPADDLHELRITCKKLRYLLECAREAAATEEQRRCVRALKGLQQVLGDFNDACLQAFELERLAEPLAERAPLALLPLGRLVEHRREAERAARAGFAERFEAFASRRTRRDFQRFEATLRGEEGRSR